MAGSIWEPGTTLVPALPATTSVSFIPGTVAAPGITFNGFSGSGFWSAGSGSVDIAVNGAHITKHNSAGLTLQAGRKLATAVEVDVASAATCDIGGAASNSVRITGTTNITSFGTTYSGPMFLRFAGALTLTNSATLIIPGGVNITVAAGDTMVVVPKATAGVADGWQVVSYYQLAASGVFGDLRANGNFGLSTAPISQVGIYMGAGKIITGSAVSYGGLLAPTIASSVTSSYQNYYSNPNTAAAAFTLTNLYHFRAVQGVIGAGSVITNQTGVYLDASLIGAGTNIGVRALLPAAASNWNIYADGTAKNHFAGNSLFGTATENASGAKIQTSNGITFPATQVASADINTLDDYEKGTFTPTIAGDAVAGVGTYTNQVGLYRKVGDMVYINIVLEWTAHTGTGNIEVRGLPFTINASYFGFPFGVTAENLTLTAGSQLIAWIQGSGGTKLWPRQMPSGGGALGAIPMDTVAKLYISGWYQAVT